MRTLFLMQRFVSLWMFWKEVCRRRSIPFIPIFQCNFCSKLKLLQRSISFWTTREANHEHCCFAELNIHLLGLQNLFFFSAHTLFCNSVCFHFSRGSNQWRCLRLSVQWGSILVKRSNEWRIRLRLTNHYSLSAGIKLHLCKWNMMWCISPLSPSQGRICSTWLEWPNSDLLPHAFRLNSSRKKNAINSGSTCICGVSHFKCMYNILPFQWLKLPTLWSRPAGCVHLLLYFCRCPTRSPGTEQQFHTNTIVCIVENTPSSDHL